MLKISREHVAVVWCAAILVLSAAAVVAGAGVTVGNGMLMLLTCLAPPAIMMAVWSGPPAPTMTEMLHDDAPVRGEGDRR